MAAALTSREFNQDTARAKREAKNGPVFITDRGKPTHVLMTIEAYEAAQKEHAPVNLRAALVDAIHGDSVQLPIPARRIDPPRQVDFD
jgi:prevent-host-death family protein